MASPRASMTDPAGSHAPSVRLPEKLAASAGLAACSVGEAAKAFSPERPGLARSFCLRVLRGLPLRRRRRNSEPVSPTRAGWAQRIYSSYVASRKWKRAAAPRGLKSGTDHVFRFRRLHGQLFAALCQLTRKPKEAYAYGSILALRFLVSRWIAHRRQAVFHDLSNCHHCGYGAFSGGLAGDSCSQHVAWCREGRLRGFGSSFRSSRLSLRYQPPPPCWRGGNSYEGLNPEKR